MCLALPGEILSIDDAQPLQRTGRVRFGAVTRGVNLAFVPEARVGDYVLVHVGFALARIDETDAARTLAEIARAMEAEAADDAAAQDRA